MKLSSKMSLVAIACTVSMATHAALVVNSSFETADLTGWGGTATTDTYGYNPFGTTYGSGMDGAHWMWLAGYEIGRTLTQTITGLTPGASYRLKFLIASEFTSADQLNVSIDGGASTLFTASPFGGSFWDTWEEKTLDFVATGSTAFLEFSSVGLNAAGYDIGLDNVRIEDLTAVPEPVSALLVAAAMLGAGAASRRRKS